MSLRSSVEVRPPRLGDDLAYMAPMAVFLIFTGIASEWPVTFEWGYAIKTVAAAALLWHFRSQYTRISWRYWWLGIIVGVVGIFQWVGMEHFIVHHWPNYPRPPHEVYVPSEHFHDPRLMWLFILVRWGGAVLVVPFMEELFWRDFLWRTILAPNDFKLAAIGEWSMKALLIVSLFFASVHIEWITAFVWGIMIGLLLVKTRSIGACIIAHGVTNFLLGAYVLYSKDWGFW